MGVDCHVLLPPNVRVRDARSRAWNLAILCGLADFFGGQVTYSDADRPRCRVHADCLVTPALGEACSPFDYVVPDKDDNANHPNTGDAWGNLQVRIHNRAALTSADVRAYEQFAAYPTETEEQFDPDDDALVQEDYYHD